MEVAAGGSLQNMAVDQVVIRKQRIKAQEDSLSMEVVVVGLAVGLQV